MISKTAMTYGGALYDLAREESLEEQILGELHAVSDLFRQNPDYTRLLMEPSIEKQERAKLIDEAWGGSVHPYRQPGFAKSSRPSAKSTWSLRCGQTRRCSAASVSSFPTGSSTVRCRAT